MRLLPALEPRCSGAAHTGIALAATLVLSCAPQRAPATTDARPPSGDAAAIVAEVDRLAVHDLWPGFDITRVPLAIFDGRRTLLFRHPNPPGEFTPHGDSTVWSVEGRHATVTANSTARIGDHLVATAVLDSAAGDATRRAELLIHEAFHVFQRERHSTWSANEVELFTYPVADSALLSLRRQEWTALRRALTPSADSAACWARAALEYRSQRMAQLAPGAAAYERKTELNEGLATYVATRATSGTIPVFTGGQDRTGADLLPAGEFAPGEVRPRAYRTGTALAFLLDRFDTGWRATLETRDTIHLDALLARAVSAYDAARASTPMPASACTIGTAERAQIAAAAGTDIQELHRRRLARRDAFMNEEGWRLVVIAGPRAPLFPQRFDPLNVDVIAPGEVLHARYLQLGNQAGTLNILGRASLTIAVGDHPLFSGIGRVTIAGLPAGPRVTATPGGHTVEADGVSGELKADSVTTRDRTVTIHLR